MYQYTICNQPDESLYRRQCKAIEEKVPGIVEAKELANIDGGAVMIYKKDGATIKVKNDVYVGGVFVDSEIELTQFFKN